MESDDATLHAEEKEVEVSTRTRTQLQDVEQHMIRSLSVLANRFFHSAYWFSTLGLRFASFSLPNLKGNMKTRREISLDSAERILIFLTDSLTRDAVQLADIAKPEPNLSVDQAVTIVEDLDEWLLKDIEAALEFYKSQVTSTEMQLDDDDDYITKYENTSLIPELLVQLKTERKILLRESRNMNSDKFLQM